VQPMAGPLLTREETSVGKPQTARRPAPSGFRARAGHDLRLLCLEPDFLPLSGAKQGRSRSEAIESL